MKYLILAGGSGTRLWPLSRKNSAKQFLNLTDPDKSMLQLTAERVSKNSGKDIFVISNKKSKLLINKQLKSILKKYNKKNFISEPIGRNTGPAIAFSTLFFNPDDIIAVLSSDHYIKKISQFNKILDAAEKIARNNYISTLGIMPNFPSTGYGYIKKSKTKIGTGFLVEKFVEKPDEIKAKKFLKEKKYFWNAGIFIFKVSSFQDELKKYSPDIYKTLQELKIKIKNKKKITLDDFMKFKNISIDYAVMEKSKNIVVLPSDIGWSDIGSFHALYEILEKEENNNVIKSKKNEIVNLDSKNLLVINNSNKKIAIIGLDNVGIINTEDSLLITSLKNSEKVKEIVDILNKNNDPEL